MRPAREISLNSNSIWELLVNALRIGNSERVAKAGASSVFVYTILEVDMRCFSGKWGCLSVSVASVNSC